MRGKKKKSTEFPQAFPYLSVKWEVGCFPRCFSLWNEMETLCCCAIFFNFLRGEKGRKWTYVVVRCGRLEAQFCTFLWTRFIWVMHLSVLGNIWGILPCLLCFKHQGKLVWSHLKEPLSQKLPYHSSYASTRQAAQCSALHVKLGLFIEPFANSDRLYPSKSKLKKLLICSNHKTRQYHFCKNSFCWGTNGRFRLNSD